MFREWNGQRSTGMKQRGFYANLRRRLHRGGTSVEPYASRQASCYQLVRQERVVVGPTTAPYPINHETPISSSDSLAELTALRDRIASESRGSNVRAAGPASWIDSIPGEKVFTYAIRKR